VFEGQDLAFGLRVLEIRGSNSGFRVIPRLKVEGFEFRV
jgi:hypothetical protein